METQISEMEIDDASFLSTSGQGGSSFRAAFNRRLAEIQAVEDDDLIPINLGVHSVVAKVLGALPRIQSLRDRLAKTPELNLALVDGLEDYAQAAAEASSRFVTASRPPREILDLNAAAENARNLFRADAVGLKRRGLLDPTRLARLKRRKGYKNVGFDLIDWTNVLEDSWEQIRGKTAITLEELLGARALGERLVRLAGARKQARALAEATRLRRQAFTLLVKAYEEVRRGVSFLRWHEDDLEAIAPSLYAAKAKASKAKTEVTAAQGTAAEIAATPATIATADVVPTPSPAPTVPPGVPGARTLIGCANQGNTERHLSHPRPTPRPSRLRLGAGQSLRSGGAAATWCSGQRVARAALHTETTAIEHVSRWSPSSSPRTLATSAVLSAIGKRCDRFARTNGVCSSSSIPSTAVQEQHRRQRLILRRRRHLLVPRQMAQKRGDLRRP